MKRLLELGVVKYEQIKENGVHGYQCKSSREKDARLEEVFKKYNDRKDVAPKNCVRFLIDVTRARRPELKIHFEIPN